MRRLPVYLLLDTSSSMSGEPIESVEKGVNFLVSSLRQDPYALETVCLSVITFGTEANQLVPLVELAAFQLPHIEVNGMTSLGEAFFLLAERIEAEVKRTTSEVKGDLRPLVFLMTDGIPTDNWEKGLNRLRQVHTGIIVACAAGPDADTNLLKQITEVVVHLDTADASAIMTFFKWVSASVSTGSQKVDQGQTEVMDLGNLPPPPPEMRIRACITEADHSNTVWQPDLAISQDNIGDALQAQGDRAASPQKTSECGREGYPPDAPPGDEVDCTIFAPPRVSVRSRFLLQVYAHLVKQAVQAREQAKEIDPSSSLRGASALGTKIAFGSRLGFELILPGCEIDVPVQHLTWRGRADYVSFEICAPKEYADGRLMGKLIVSQDNVPIGRIKFTIELTEYTAEKATKAVMGNAKRFNLAFISYCSKDLDEVLRRVQMLSLAGVPFVQDLLNLEPGERFEPKLLQWIDESDVMFLFWSHSAKKSSWVEKEWKYALKCKDDDYILPVIIEGPPFPEPPSELQHLHWSDKILYFLSKNINRVTYNN